MSRRRWFVDGLAMHAHQRGNNRVVIFHDDYDRVVFLRILVDTSRKYRVAVHAWVLMNNHFHLLATPAKRESLPRMMQQLGRRYVRHFNRRYQRTGTLWEGRYKAHLIDSERYWFECVRYIELNPVRAGMVTAADEHRWCSYQSLGNGATDLVVTPHPLYLGLGATEHDRQRAYRTLCASPLCEPALAAIRDALAVGGALGVTEPSAVEANAD